MTNYNTVFEQLTELTEKIGERQSEWFRHLLLIASSLLGILVSLHSKTDNGYSARLIFLLVVFFLMFGILTGSLCLYAEIHAMKKAKRLYIEEAKNSLAENRDIQAVFSKKPLWFSVCQVSTYIIFSGSVMLLAVYELLIY